MLADRYVSYGSIVAALAAGAALAALEATRKVHRCVNPPRSWPAVVAIKPPPIDIDCPVQARAAIRIEQPLALFCRFTDRGTFVVAQYMTTERWERMALVDTDGALVYPLVDQPTPGNLPMTDVSIGGPDKIIGYSNGRSLRVTFDRDVLALDYSRE